jgi:hypothetical protein
MLVVLVVCTNIGIDTRTGTGTGTGSEIRIIRISVALQSGQRRRSLSASVIALLTLPPTTPPTTRLIGIAIGERMRRRVPHGALRARDRGEPIADRQPPDAAVDAQVIVHHGIGLREAEATRERGKRQEAL